MSDDDGIDWERENIDAPDETPYDFEIVNITAAVDDDGRMSFVFELDDGSVIHAGDKGGFTQEYIDQLVEDHGEDWARQIVDDVLEQSYAKR